MTQLSPVKIILISALIGGLAKIIERFSKDIALGCQLFSFALVMYAIVKYFNSK
jgi:hypothetical protein